MKGKRIRPEEVLGKRFGSWTVVGRRENGKYLCRCDCGTEYAIDGFRLVNGTSTRCKQCARRSRDNLDGLLIGRKVGMLTVLRRCESPPRYAPNASSWFLCRCDCGYEVARRGHDLKAGLTYSCGCTQRPRKKKEVTECQSTT